MNLVDRVRAFRGKLVLVIGDTMLDSYYEGTAARLCSEGPVPVVRRTGEEHQPGGAANTAANLSQLGATVDLVALIGNDAAGQMLRTVLAEYDVGDDLLVTEEGAGTLQKLRVLADDQYVVRFDSGDAGRHDPACRGALVRNLRSRLEHVDAVVISDYTYGAVDGEVLSLLAQLQPWQHMPVIVDTKQLPKFAALPVTAITPNYLEARLAVQAGEVPSGDLDLGEVAHVAASLLNQVKAERTIITLGRHGAFLYDRDDASFHAPAPQVGNVNDIGAGDSFTSALALAVAGGASWEEAVTIAVTAGSLAVAKPRTAVVHHQELLQRISRSSATLTGSLEDLVATLEADKAAGGRLVFTNGVFDILHAGHVRFLRDAKALGDVLVVGVNSDRSARALKGRSRPINAEQDRLALVSALDAVDHAFLFDEETPEEPIRLVRPHVHAKGGDYQGEDLPEAAAVREVGGEVVILPLNGDLSTTGVIDRIVRLAQEEPVGAAS